MDEYGWMDGRLNGCKWINVYNGFMFGWIDMDRYEWIKGMGWMNRCGWMM